MDTETQLEQLIINAVTKYVPASFLFSFLDHRLSGTWSDREAAIVEGVRRG